jgi:nitroreductase
MQFGEVIRRRKMVRTFLDRPVGEDVLSRILAAGHRAPSAGFSQGFSFLVWSGSEETGRFWASLQQGGSAPDWVEGLRRSAAVVVPLASKQAYLDRYAEEDKGWGDRDEARWPTPYWFVDTAFAAMLILLAAVDEGLGALFFGIPAEGIGPFRKVFGVPEEWHPIGAIALGHPAPEDPVRSSRDTRPRKALEEIVHRGRW